MRENDGTETGGLYNYSGDLRLQTQLSQGPVYINGTGGTDEITVSDREIRYDAPIGESVVVHSNKPSNPASGEVKRLIADGTNWDPDGDGNAEVVYLLPDGSVIESVDLGQGL